MDDISSSEKKMGRPSSYNFELAREICGEIANSSKGITRLCKENPHWPNQDTIYLWLKVHSNFSEMYARSKQIQVDLLVDEILNISDDSSNDTLITKYGKHVPNHEHINRDRLRVDTRKWLAAKLCPRIYGNLSVQRDSYEVEMFEILQKLVDSKSA